MGRVFSGDTLVIASHNCGKVAEIGSLLGDLVATFPSSADFGLAEPEETGNTFAENAALKARYTALHTDLPALADDSGLSVAALEGAPGIYSARWAVRPDGQRDFTFAMGRVERCLIDRGLQDARAAFVCALSLAWPDGHVETVEGRVDGILVFPARGTRGFGYDPIFLPDGHDRTFGEMTPDEKHAISHRADAFARLRQYCFAVAG